MKTKGSVFILLIMAFAALVPGSGRVWGASEVPPGPDGPFTIDPTAKGKRLSGTVAVHYESAGAVVSQCVFPEFEVNMKFSLRLRRGLQDPVGFAGTAESTPAEPLCLEDLPKQQQIIEAFMQTDVIPRLFPDTPDAPFVLTAVNDVVQDDQFSAFAFAMLDVEYRVKVRAASN